MDYIATFTDGHQESILAHYGITGMKWYRRRYQNPDGSLTPAGRARYLKNAEKADVYRQKASDARFKSAKYSYKHDKIAGRRVQTDLSMDKANRLAENSSRANVKAAKYERKAMRLEKANKDLETPVEWSEKQLRKRRLTELSKLDDEANENFSRVVYDNSEVRNKLASVERSVLGVKALDSTMSSGHGEGFAIDLAYRFSEDFDSNSKLRSSMKKHIDDYEAGRISKKELSKIYDTELCNYSSEFVKSASKETLEKVAKTFYKENDPEFDAPDNFPKSGIDAFLENYSLKSKSTNDGKSFGRYKTGSKSEADTYKPDEDNWKEVSKGVYEPTEKLSKQPKGKYISVIAKNGSRSMVRIEDKASAAVTLGFMGLSQSEIASKLGLSEEQVKKELNSYRSPVYNGGIGVGRISKK